MNRKYKDELKYKICDLTDKIVELELTGRDDKLLNELIDERDMLIYKLYGEI